MSRSEFEREFGGHLRSCRRARGLTQEQLAERAELAADTIGRVEAGVFSPTVETLRCLARGLGLDLVTMMTSFEGSDLAPRSNDSAVGVVLAEGVVSRLIKAAFMAP